MITDYASENEKPANKTVMYIVIDNLQHLGLSEVYIKPEPHASQERIKLRTSTTTLCNSGTEGQWRLLQPPYVTLEQKGIGDWTTKALLQPPYATLEQMDSGDWTAKN